MLFVAARMLGGFTVEELADAGGQENAIAQVTGTRAAAERQAAAHAPPANPQAEKMARDAEREQRAAERAARKKAEKAEKAEAEKVARVKSKLDASDGDESPSRRKKGADGAADGAALRAAHGEQTAPDGLRR